ncbi:hypothetical protein FRB93_010978 [Tulasnella sp. JGI-2019a]|nr:hypothetical protein FRB93_010978 [Tulasnella sp. JGI-2019a]
MSIRLPDTACVENVLQSQVEVTSLTAPENLRLGSPDALNLPEIRLLVFEELGANDLLNAALVCKAWSWPAISTAWNNSNIILSWFLAPLVECTVKELQIWTDSDLLPIIANCKVICHEQWDSRLQYAGKITRLFVDVTWKVTSAIIMQLIDPLGGPICPNLLSLRLNIDGRELSDEVADMERWTPLLHLLVGPRLNELTLAFYGVTERVVKDNIQSMTHVAPRIHTVIIENHTNSLSSDYSAFVQMRTLKLRGLINHESWRCLSSCSRLENIVLWGNERRRSIGRQHYSVTFPHVKTLSIECRDAEFTIALLQGATIPALQSLKIKFSRPDNADIEAASMREILKFMRRSPLLKEAVIGGRECMTMLARDQEVIIGTVVPQ